MPTLKARAKHNPGPLQAEGVKGQADLAKQIITLSTGAIAFTVTFLEKFSSTVDGRLVAPGQLYVAWLLFVVAIITALWNLMALNGTLEALDFHANGWTASDNQKLAAEGNDAHSRLPALLMLAAFVGALVVLGIAGAKALEAQPAASEKKAQPCCCILPAPATEPGEKAACAPPPKG